MRRESLLAQRGQAMTEFLVACLVLIPVFLAIPLLGKYMDIGHSGVQGMRYLAWERTVWTPDRKSNAALENEMRHRIFTPVGAPLRADDGGAPPAQYNPLWNNAAGKPMLVDYAAVAGHTESGKGQTTPGLIYSKVTSTLTDVFNTVMGWLDAIGGVRHEGFDANIAGMYSGSIALDIAEQGAATAGIGMVPPLLHVDAMTITPRANFIITDAWGVSGPGSSCPDKDAKTELCQTAALLPTTALSGWVNTVTHDVGYAIPEFKRLDYGHIVPGVVPADRQP